MTRELLAQALPVLLQFLLALLAPVLVVMLRKLLRRLHAEEYERAAVTLGRLAGVLVGRASQTIVADLKDPEKPGDWTEALGKSTKSAVVSQLRILGRSSLETLRGQGHSDAELGELLDALVESAVRRDKASVPPLILAEPIDAPTTGSSR